MSESKGSGLAASLRSMEERTVVTVAPVQPPRLPARPELYKRITLVIDPDFHLKLKMHAVASRVSLEDIYREALRDYCQKHGI